MSLFKRLFRPLAPLEQFAQSGWATACSPDELIAASLLESFAKEPELWVVRKGDGIGFRDRWATAREAASGSRRWRQSERFSSIITRSGPNPVTIVIPCEERARDGDGCAPWIVRQGLKGIIRVSDVGLDPKTSARLLTQMWKLDEQRKAAEKVAGEALAKMKQNEKKWEIAEKLLNMKRNEFGALEPVNKQQEETQKT